MISLVTLKDASRTICLKYPKHDIHGVGEYPDIYEFWLKNKGEIFDKGVIGILPAVIVYKSNGTIKDGLIPGEWCNFSKEPNRYYTEQEIENLLK